MTALRYVGRNADDSTAAARIVIDKGGADSAYSAYRVDASYVNTALLTASANLASTGYVTTQDNLRAKKTDVQDADAAYVPLTELAGVSGGVVPLNSTSTTIPTSRIPATIKLSRNPTIHTVGTGGVFLTANQVMDSSPGPKKFKAATISIPDPGFPYIPLPFALVQGGALGATDFTTRSMTTGNYGQLSILDANDVRYGWAVCDSRKVLDFHTCLPFAAAGVTPTARPPVSGPMTLDLWLGLYSGTTYTYTPSLTFYVLCFPGLAG